MDGPLTEGHDPMVTLVQTPPQKPLTLEDRVEELEAEVAQLRADATFLKRALIYAFSVAKVPWPETA